MNIMELLKRVVRTSNGSLNRALKSGCLIAKTPAIKIGDEWDSIETERNPFHDSADICSACCSSTQFEVSSVTALLFARLR